MTDDQIKHMVNRFLGWRLPENFSPDAGISFKPTFNDHMPFGPQKHGPIGTNLFDATQAEAMVRYMIDGMPVGATGDASAPQAQTVNQSGVTSESAGASRVASAQSEASPIALSSKQQGMVTSAVVRCRSYVESTRTENEAVIVLQADEIERLQRELEGSDAVAVNAQRAGVKFLGEKREAEAERDRLREFAKIVVSASIEKPFTAEALEAMIMRLKIKGTEAIRRSRTADETSDAP